MTDFDIEKIVIEKLIEEPDNISKCRVDYFQQNISKHIYSHLLHKYTKGEAIKIEKIVLEAQNDKYNFNQIFQQVGSSSYRSESGEFYVTILKEKYFERKLTEYHVKSISEIQKPQTDFTKIFEDLEAIKQEMLNTIEMPKVVLSESIDLAVHAMYKRREQYEQGVIDYQTGYVEFDNLIRPEKGNIFTIACRPRIGKTSFANNLAMNYAQSGEVGKYFSIEMSNLSLSNRFLLSKNENINIDKFKKGNIEDHDCMKIENSLEDFKGLDIELIDNKNHINDIVQTIDVKCKTENVTFAIIDYAQIVEAEGANDNVKIDNIYKKLKACAKRNNMIIIILSQLNRESEKRGGNRYKLADLRNGGAIEQASDIIIFLHRDAEVDKHNGLEVDWNDQEVRNISLQVAKNKNGETADLKLYHNRTISRFYELGEAYINDEFDTIVNNNENAPF